jgi:3-oxoadipate enol-lactonase
MSTEAPIAAESVFRLRDGTRLVYETRGDTRSNRRIALVHSLAMDRHFWGPVADRLAANACILLYDCRGHGASDKPPGPYTVDLFADDLVALMDHVGWPRAAVAGASMGGSITLGFGIRHPTRTAGLGLIDTTAWYGPGAPEAWSKRAKAALETGLSSLIDFQTTRWFGDRFRETHPDVVRSCVDTFLRNDLPAYAETCRMLGNFDLRNRLGEIATPTRIVVGEEDYATPVKMAEELAANIRGSTMAVLPGARHLTPLEQPDRIASELSGLLDRIAGQ